MLVSCSRPRTLTLTLVALSLVPLSPQFSLSLSLSLSLAPLTFTLHVGLTLSIYDLRRPHDLAPTPSPMSPPYITFMSSSPCLYTLTKHNLTMICICNNNNTLITGEKIILHT